MTRPQEYREQRIIRCDTHYEVQDDSAKDHIPSRVCSRRAGSSGCETIPKREVRGNGFAEGRWYRLSRPEKVGRSEPVHFVRGLAVTSSLSRDCMSADETAGYSSDVTLTVSIPFAQAQQTAAPSAVFNCPSKPTSPRYSPSFPATTCTQFLRCIRRTRRSH